MNKSNLILKYFQKANRLTTKNKEYSQTLAQLFHWLSSNDEIHNDKSSKYLPNVHSNAVIVSKDNGIIAGLEEIKYLLKTNTKLSYTSQLTDGDKIKKGDIIARISGKSHEILSYERTILNILQRMSGIATETKYITNIIVGDASEGLPNEASPTLSPDVRRGDFEAKFGIHKRQDPQIKPFIAATRKTPWVMLDKKAVAVGGGLTHRLSLSDGILIKDNHLVNNSVETALITLLKKYSNELIEIEVTNSEQAHKVIITFQKYNHDNHLAILLDNFSPIQVKKLLNNFNRQYDLSQIIFEASGGITEKNIKEWAKTGVDIISLGSLTHSTHAANLSLEICPF